jgi:hypothetical protein
MYMRLTVLAERFEPGDGDIPFGHAGKYSRSEGFSYCGPYSLHVQWTSSIGICRLLKHNTHESASGLTLSRSRMVN